MIGTLAQGVRRAPCMFPGQLSVTYKMCCCGPRSTHSHSLCVAIMPSTFEYNQVKIRVKIHIIHVEKKLFQLVFDLSKHPDFEWTLQWRWFYQKLLALCFLWALQQTDLPMKPSTWQPQIKVDTRTRDWWLTDFRLATSLSMVVW